MVRQEVLDGFGLPPSSLFTVDVVHRTTSGTMDPYPVEVDVTGLLDTRQPLRSFEPTHDTTCTYTWPGTRSVRTGTKVS